MQYEDFVINFNSTQFLRQQKQNLVNQMTTAVNQMKLWHDGSQTVVVCPLCVGCVMSEFESQQTNKVWCAKA